MTYISCWRRQALVALLEPPQWAGLEMWREWGPVEDDDFIIFQGPQASRASGRLVSRHHSLLQVLGFPLAFTTYVGSTSEIGISVAIFLGLDLVRGQQASEFLYPMAFTAPLLGRQT